MPYFKLLIFMVLLKNSAAFRRCIASYECNDAYM